MRAPQVAWFYSALWPEFTPPLTTLFARQWAYQKSKGTRVSIEAPNSKTNQLGAMLDKAFQKFDQNKDGKLDQTEFASFNEILKPGIAVDSNGKPSTDFSKKMDQNSDGGISQNELDSTSVLMPASLTSDSFSNLINYLNIQATPESLKAASLLSSEDPDSV